MSEEISGGMTEEDNLRVFRVSGLSKRPQYVAVPYPARELRGYYDSHPLEFIERRCDTLLALEPSQQGDEKLDRAHDWDSRMLYLAALESLLATWVAHLELSAFPPAWLLLYRTQDLKDRVKDLAAEASAFISGARAPWHQRVNELFPFLNPGEAADPERRALAQCMLTWGDDFEKYSSEYNGVKHGLRVRSGAMSISMLPESEPAAPGFSMSAHAGSHVPYLKPLAVPDFEGRVHQYTVKSVGRDPRRDLSRLRLLCAATRNLLTQARARFLRIKIEDYRVIGTDDLRDRLHGMRGDLLGIEFSQVLDTVGLKEILDDWEGKGSSATQ